MKWMTYKFRVNGNHTDFNRKTWITRKRDTNNIAKIKLTT